MVRLTPQAQAWLEDALAEHASIAAFSQLSLQLLALGAPPDLLKRCHEAALDEIEHAKVCFRLASEAAHTPLGPGEFPELKGTRIPNRSHAELAVESLLDGCLMEGAAASSLAAMSELEPSVARKAILRRLADDEVRHTELAWHILQWCLECQPEPTLKALRRAELEVRRMAAPKMPQGVPGRLHPEAQEACFESTRTQVLTKLACVFSASQQA